MQFRNIILLAIAIGSLVGSALVAPGCLLPGTNAGTNCDYSIPLTCCQCPWPEDCPPYAPEWPKLPQECKQYIDGGADVGGDPFGDASSSFCSSGTCVSPAPEAWKHVAFVQAWPEPPPCPDDAPNVVFEGLPAPPDRVCPGCLCDEPDGACSLPTTWTVSSQNCDNASNGVKTNFDPPSGWDGTCSNTNAIAQGKLCGGLPCVQSLTLSLPFIEEKPCVPHTQGLVELPVLKLWNDGPAMPFGRACASDKPLPSCSGKGCVSTNSQFQACVMHDGDQACPEGWNGDRHVLYKHVDDARECTPCGCDAPTGSTCQVKWRIFSDPSCTAEKVSAEVSAGMMTEACTYLDPGVGLAGKTAEVLTYTKGSCAPTGGELVGNVDLQGEVTVCCHSSPM